MRGFVTSFLYGGQAQNPKRVPPHWHTAGKQPENATEKYHYPKLWGRFLPLPLH